MMRCVVCLLDFCCLLVVCFLLFDCRVVGWNDCLFVWLSDD